MNRLLQPVRELRSKAACSSGSKSTLFMRSPYSWLLRRGRMLIHSSPLFQHVADNSQNRLRSYGGRQSLEGSHAEPVQTHSRCSRSGGNHYSVHSPANTGGTGKGGLSD